LATYSYDKMKSTYITAEIQWSCRTGKASNPRSQHYFISTRNSKTKKISASWLHHIATQIHKPSRQSYRPLQASYLMSSAHSNATLVTSPQILLKSGPVHLLFSESKTDSSNVWKPFPILTSISWDYRQCQSPTPLHPSCSSWSDCPVLAPQRSPTSASQGSSRHPYPESLSRQQTKTKCWL